MGLEATPYEPNLELLPNWNLKGDKQIEINERIVRGDFMHVLDGNRMVADDYICPIGQI
jgi:hypothetical protein